MAAQSQLGPGSQDASACTIPKPILVIFLPSPCERHHSKRCGEEGGGRVVIKINSSLSGQFDYSPGGDITHVHT